MTRKNGVSGNRAGEQAKVWRMTDIHGDMTKAYPLAVEEDGALQN